MPNLLRSWKKMHQALFSVCSPFPKGNDIRPKQVPSKDVKSSRKHIFNCHSLWVWHAISATAFRKNTDWRWALNHTFTAIFSNSHGDYWATVASHQAQSTLSLILHPEAPEELSRSSSLVRRKLVSRPGTLQAKRFPQIINHSEFCLNTIFVW